jgi:hypothetical protein
MIKYLLKNINLLNIILSVTLVFLAVYIVLPAFGSRAVKYTPPSAAIKTPAGGNEEQQHGQMQAPSPVDYVMIAEKNLFHPERIIPFKETQQSVQKPEFILYGTLITNDLSLAYMEDKKSPQSTEGRGKRQIALRKGETLAGFVLQEVDAEKVVMARQEDKIVVYLQTPEKAKMREEAAATIAAPQPPAPQPLQRPVIARPGAAPVISQPPAAARRPGIVLPPSANTPAPAPAPAQQ